MTKGSILFVRRLRCLRRHRNGFCSRSSRLEPCHDRPAENLLHRCSMWARMEHSAATDPEQADERVSYLEKIRRLLDEIASLSNKELAATSGGLRKVRGLPEPPPIGEMPVGGMVVDWQEGAAEGGAPTEEKAPEKTTFSVKIEKFDEGSKIKVIKEVRAICDLGLEEAKEFVEKVPAVLKDGLTKEEATKLIEKLKAVGATSVME